MLEKIAAGVLGVILIVLVLGLLAAWPLMVLWGAVADDFGIQTIGLGTAWQISVLSSLLFKSNSASSSS